ncbi:MAG: hypothetical protein JNK87_42365 [Bryobacterales bacterium]|nr:hypothetical protein [Bryobacterales bacterium]
MVIFGILLLLAAYGMAARFALWRHDARPLSQSEGRWQTAAQRLAARVGIAVPRLYVIPESAPNAMVAVDAAGPVLAVTEGLLRHGNAHEVEAVLARGLERVRREPVRLRVQSTAAVFRGFLRSVVQFASWGLAGLPPETAPLFVMPLAV